MKASFTNLAIAASAGSGKTYALSHRVLGLLAHGVSPDRIGAYTFSRKAAGEIFDSIVAYLCAAASDPEKARNTAETLEKPDHSRDDFLQDLRRLLGNGHRLQIGTLDSRISRMLQSATIELGLPPDLHMLESQGAEATQLRIDVLDSLLLPGQADNEIAETFLNAFRLSTFGKEEHGFDRLIRGFLDDHREVFLGQPALAAWRHPGALALDDIPDVLDAAERESLQQSLLQELERCDCSASAKTAVRTMIDGCAAYNASSVWGDAPTKGVLWKQFLSGEEPTYRNKALAVSDAFREKLCRLQRHVFGVALTQSFHTTLGIYAVLAGFEERYRERILSGGWLTFEDATSLMGKSLPITPNALAFRLDQQIDHWLLDEFQDTSDLQWAALRPLIEEVLQDPEQRRSFFYVGDVKQAIYGWRGGNANLFGQILEHHGNIRQERLDTSFRSAEVILHFVNHLFDNVPQGELPDRAIRKWNEQFSPHIAAQDKAGEVSVLRVEENEQLARAVADRLIALDPPHRGLDVAILVRSNATGRKLAQDVAAIFQTEGISIPLVLEGHTPLRSDLAIETIRAWFRLALHPGDDYSQILLAMSPLASRSHRPIAILQQVQREGLAACIAELAACFQDLPDYSRQRLEQLLDFALEFEAGREARLDRFLDALDAQFLREQTGGGAVRIMTIHQSKGLGFDAVLLPELGSDFFKSPSNELVTAAASDDCDPDWVLQLPQKDVCEYVHGLSGEYARMEAEQCYEGFCNLYVAMTRAKQGLYLFLPPPPKKPGSLRKFSNWIGARLEAPTAGESADGLERLYQDGDPDWAAAVTIDHRPPESTDLPLPALPAPALLQRIEPSAADDEQIDLGSLFQEIAQDGRGLGSAVHEALEHLDWADETDEDAWIREHAPDDQESGEQLRQVFEAGELRSALSKPDNPPTLWREKAFEIALDRGWISGVFDRVLIFDDHAIIQDYKTNRIQDEEQLAEKVEHYRPQMELYREVLAEILGFSEDRIRCQLLFTRIGRVIEVSG